MGALEVELYNTRRVSPKLGLLINHEIVCKELKSSRSKNVKMVKKISVTRTCLFENQNNRRKKEGKI